MGNQTPSVDWQRRTIALIGDEDLLKQNPIGDTDVDEQRIPVSLVGDYSVERVKMEVGLEELSNVPVPSTSSILSFNGSEYFWDSMISGFTFSINGDSGSSSLSAGGTLSIIGGDAISTVGSNPSTITINFDGSLNDLSDVTISSPTSNQAILYNGSEFVNGDLSGLFSASNGIVKDGSNFKLGGNPLIENTLIETNTFEFTIDDTQTNKSYMGVSKSVDLDFADNGVYLASAHGTSNTKALITSYIAGNPFNEAATFMGVENTGSTIEAYVAVTEDNVIILSDYDNVLASNQAGATFNSTDARIYKSFNAIDARMVANPQTGSDGTYMEIENLALDEVVGMGIFIDSDAGAERPQPYIRTRGVDIATAKRGQRLLLENANTGEVDWRYGRSISVTGTTTVSVEYDLIVVSDPVGGGYTVTIPDANTCEGKMLVISRLTDGGGVITINPENASLIAESLNISIAESSGLTVISDGTNWLRAGQWV